mgnify:FL=1
MKKLLNYILAIIMIINCIVMFSISSQADFSSKLPSIPIGEPKINIEKIFEEKLIKERIEKDVNILCRKDNLTNFTYEPSMYLLEYGVSIDFWNNNISNYYDMIQNIDYNYPTIFVPILSVMTDSHGNASNREIGYIKLYYDCFENDYRHIVGIYNITSDDFTETRPSGFFESVTDYLVENRINAQQVFLIEYPSSLTDGQEVVAVIHSNSDTIMLDISNTCRNNKDWQDNPRAYSIKDYRTLRVKAEKDIYKHAGGFVDNVNKNNDNNNSNYKLVKNIILISVAVIAVIAISVILLVIKNTRKARSEKNPTAK